MEYAICLSNEKAIEEAMKELGIKELKDKLREAILHEGIIYTTNYKSVIYE